jgi:hypothetical protein
LLLSPGTAREAVALALETGLEEHDPALGIDLKRIPHVTPGHGMKISQLKGVSRPDHSPEKSFPLRLQR